MMISQESLDDAGILVSVDVFQRMARDASERLRRSGFVTNPHEELTPAEVEALRRGGLDLSPLEHAVDDPVARTAAEYLALVESSMSVAEAAALLGVDPSRIRQRLSARSLYGIKARGQWKIPSFQFDGTRLLPGIEIVVRRLDPGLYPLGVFNWFTNPDVDLEVGESVLSPREWLRAGREPEVVAELAESLGQAW